jgi:LemA protein
MKKSTIIILSIVAVFVIAIFWGISAYNSLVKMDENVTEKWAQVDNVYKRRADLIPNLVNVVKGYAAHESQTLENVIAARAKATSITIDPTTATPEQLQAFANAQDGIGAALGRLMAVSENYPDLKANQNFLQLQSELEGTENRITVERKRYNEACGEFNKKIRTIPYSFFGFEKRNYFEASESERAVPEVQF